VDYDKFIQLVNRYVPIKSFCNKYSHPPWLTKSILHAIISKHKLWIKYKITRQISDYQKYTLQLNIVTTLVRSTRATYESDIASKVQTNPKQFWAYINQTAKVKPCIGMLERKDGTTINNDTEIATMLNDYFCTVFTIRIFTPVCFQIFFYNF